MSQAYFSTVKVFWIFSISNINVIQFLRANVVYIVTCDVVWQRGDDKVIPKVQGDQWHSVLHHLPLVTENLWATGNPRILSYVSLSLDSPQVQSSECNGVVSRTYPGIKARLQPSRTCSAPPRRDSTTHTGTALAWPDTRTQSEVGCRLVIHTVLVYENAAMARMMPGPAHLQCDSSVMPLWHTLMLIFSTTEKNYTVITNKCYYKYLELKKSWEITTLIMATLWRPQMRRFVNLVWSRLNTRNAILLIENIFDCFRFCFWR